VRPMNPRDEKDIEQVVSDRGLRDLGREFRQRRTDLGLTANALAVMALVKTEDYEAFERGEFMFQGRAWGRVKSVLLDREREAKARENLLSGGQE